ncbi:uncharacterized protein N0V89_004284 [Didymosphaeria variabile]|uniref:Helicase ATP-binding domain-containing protein n=1 Tax=Didymosphaeria variabile TaxID=1932322 RepID=A0A9W8XRW3_9PLEO|nr:uncharacterized protein N0V89_004284 [Didymosphaeria variabile]KAJ4356253.1 hypothetical protein N0V89_004284 [Didymosphaeria variabile]
MPGHTACVLHAGNPKHVYANTVERTMSQQSPNTFINEWRPKLPSRIIFKNFSGFSFSEFFQAQIPHDSLTKAFGKRLTEVDVESRHFYIEEFTRHVGFWKVLYKSEQANLELSVGEELQWLLYVHCSPEVAGDSALRKFLKNPVARGSVKDSLLSVEWEIFVPSVRSIPLSIQGSPNTSQSFRSSLGLLDFLAETIPASLHIHHDGKKPIDFPDDWDNITGDYDHLPHCGTASNCLYKRSSEPPLYFFLNPDPLSRGSDSFHFSFNCERLQPGDQRVSLAHLNSSWRPWNSIDTNYKSVDAISPGKWERAVVGTIMLASDALSLSAKVLAKTKPLSEHKHLCTTAISVLEIVTSEALPIKNIDDYLWALDNVTSAPSFLEWQSFGPSSVIECACTPAYPRLRWNIDKAGVATASEDPKEAATRERALKTRCPIYHIEAETFDKATRIRFGVNISSLAHRAIRSLVRTRQSTPTELVEVTWRLLTHQRGTASVRFPKFWLQSNANDKPFSKQLKIAYELRGAQPRALEWMRAQERGTNFTFTDIEEAIHEKLGWRVEARAQANTLVRGGVLADRPSFGKTVITIALIQSEFEEYREDKSVIERNNSTTRQKLHLIDTAATLIVCPPHLVDQWQEEFKKFLGTNQYDHYRLVLIKTFAELRSLDFEHVQTSRVIIISWAVLADREYVAYLAEFAAMPEPATASNVKGASNYRAFDAWMNRVCQELPAQLAKQQQMSSADFNTSTDRLLHQRLSETEFNMSLPLQLRHGSQYQPYNSTQAAKKKSETKVNSKKGRPRRSSVPLLHLFRFNRIVVDEYHYLNVHQKDQKKTHENLLSSVGIKTIAAHKRWVLSGTPALESFSDVDNIASFLNIRLGRYAVLVNTGKRTQVEEMQREAQTKVEKFLSHKETMSLQWHQTRHQFAQEFLDKFVRQNDPSLEHIRCSESLQVIELDVAHHAVYLELSQYLIAQRMALKRMKNAEGADRTNRLNASLNGCNTGEDALLKCALLYETYHDESGLRMLLQKRSEEYNETVLELQCLLRGFEGHRKTRFKGLQKSEKEEASIFQLYTYFRKDFCIDNWLGDNEATAKIRALLKHAESNPVCSGFIKGKTLDEKIKNAKKALSKLRTFANQLAFRTRSERFISNVQSLIQPLCESSSITRRCDALECRGYATMSDLYITSSCGHLSCERCLAARIDSGVCVVPSCNTTVQAMNLIQATHIGSQKEQISGRSFGRKLDAVAKLINELPFNDQGLVFAPNIQTISDLRELCDHHGISYLTPTERNPAKAIQNFKTSSDKKVLILDLTSETAAGV